LLKILASNTCLAIFWLKSYNKNESSREKKMLRATDTRLNEARIFGGQADLWT
jgi:hypothetical protein